MTGLLRRARAMSLIEAMVGITVMGAAAIMYASAWKTHGGFSDAAREIEIATELFQRQVERIRSKSLIDTTGGSAIVEDAFQKKSTDPTVVPPATDNCQGCPPVYSNQPAPGHTHYVDPPGAGTNQLSWNNPITKLLTSTNAFPLPPHQPPATVAPFDQSWVLDIDSSLDTSPGGQGFSIQVFASRIQDAVQVAPYSAAACNVEASHLQQLVKFRVLVNRDTGTGLRTIVSGEFIMEAR